MNILDYIYESNDTSGEWGRGGESGGERGVGEEKVEGREGDLKKYYFLRKSLLNVQQSK